MDFDFDKDFNIFDPLFEKRPEISKESLKKDLKDYYLPFAQKLIDLKKNQSSENGLIVGVSAIQGAGKTTQGEIMDILLKFFGFSPVSLSIDDHYITYKELNDLRSRDPRFIRRGVTHDISLAMKDLENLQKMDDLPILISGYDKGAHKGDGDRFKFVNPTKDLRLTFQYSNGFLKLLKIEAKGQNLSLPEEMGEDIPLSENIFPEDATRFLSSCEGEIVLLEEDEENAVFSSGESKITVPKKDLPNGWNIVSKKPDFIFYDGWMLGAKRVEDESIFDSGLPALETEESRDFAKMVNKKLDEYLPLWEMLDFLNILYVPDYEISLKWRDQAEEALREKGEGMSHEEIVKFVHYFWRSVHPGIHIKNLAYDSSKENQQVVIIENDHSIGKVTSPSL